MKTKNLHDVGFGFQCVKRIKPKQSESKSELMSVDEVCDLLKVSKPTLWRWRKHGDIPFVKYGRKVWFKKTDIDRFIEDNYIESRT